MAARIAHFAVVSAHVRAVKNSTAAYAPTPTTFALPVTLRDEKWLVKLDRLDQYIDRTGNALVPLQHKEPDGMELGSWVRYQRRSYRIDTLAPEKAATLELRAGWSWDPDADRWANAIAHLDAFSAENGTAWVPTLLVCQDGYRLGQWANDQRRNYWSGTRNISPERIASLEARSGWAWNGWVPTSMSWRKALARLDEHVAEHGTAWVGNRYIHSDGFTLGRWAAVQRERQRAGLLHPVRAVELASRPGWLWTASRDGRWRAAVHRLDHHLAVHGTARVISTHVAPDGYLLGQWAARQRRLHRLHQLNPDRVAELETKPGWDWVRRAASQA
ncbi:helicase associated domain-containing protein [Agromyces sp. NPDC057679]|uniref:helicase associated domain-containing protein n=1 Tax=Agromyces sp. NPDC057679 TaxID=3346207 RepID=UPI00366C56BA